MSAALAVAGGDLAPLLRAEIVRARRSVWLAVFLCDLAFARDPERQVRRVVGLLGQAAADGLDVRLLLAQPPVAGVAVANRAAALYAAWSGVDVRLSPEDEASHAKVALFDGVRVLVGGHNLTHSGLARNEEVTLLVDGAGSAAVADALQRFAVAWERASPVVVEGTALEGVAPW